MFLVRVACAAGHTSDARRGPHPAMSLSVCFVHDASTEVRDIMQTLYNEHRHQVLEHMNMRSGTATFIDFMRGASWCCVGGGRHYLIARFPPGTGVEPASFLEGIDMAFDSKVINLNLNYIPYIEHREERQAIGKSLY